MVTLVLISKHRLYNEKPNTYYIMRRTSYVSSYDIFENIISYDNISNKYMPQHTTYVPTYRVPSGSSKYLH